jgi:lipoate-protein ligase A
VNTWRLIEVHVGDAFTNMAIDEAITVARINDVVPNTLRLYRWKPSAVSIGRFQDLFNEVHADDCRQQGVDLVRRITGGGAVYHSCQNEITYSVIAREKDFGSADVIYAYSKICNGLAEAAKILGICAESNQGDPRNCPNIAVGGKKISGSAQYHRGGVLLQHGTFLLDVNLKEMFTFLRVPWAKTVDDVVCVAKDRLTSIGKELKRDVGIKEASEALVQGFRKVLGLEFMNEGLTKEERQLASKLRSEKYSTEKWNTKGIF